MRHTTSLRLLAVATVLVLLLFVTSVTAHDDLTVEAPLKCGSEQLLKYHNVTTTAVVLKYEERKTGAVVYESTYRSHDNSYKPIRIAAFFHDLEEPSKYCASASGTAPDFQGGTASCSSDTVLTEEKKNILKTKLVPEAIQLHSDRLSVERVTGTLGFPPDPVGSCALFSVPPSHKTDGVPDADFLLYVAAGPTSGGTAAWATICTVNSNSNGDTLRPLTAVMNVSPKHIASTTSSVRTVAHELLHALGFGNFYFNASGMFTWKPVREKAEAPVIISPNVVSAARHHYGCNNLINMELDEDVDVDADIAHWKRRNAKDELMTSGSTHGYYSAMTIAAMEDLGYYQGDYSKAEIMPWGNGAGCKFITDMCMTNNVSLNQSMFCTDGDYVCTSDRDAVGTCYTSSASLPSWAYNYGLFNDVDTMDYCPYVLQYSGAGCADGNISYVPNSKFGDTSRCLDVSTGRAVCAAITCSKSSYKVQFNTGKAVTCTPGTKVKIPKTRRTVTCPPYSEVCNMLCGNDCAPQGAFVMMATHCTSVLFVLLGVLLLMLA